MSYVYEVCVFINTTGLEAAKKTVKQKNMEDRKKWNKRKDVKDGTAFFPPAYVRIVVQTIAISVSGL